VTVAEEIRARARALLESGDAEIVIGFENGTVPLTARPALIADAAACERLVWNRLCAPGLAPFVQEYLRERRKQRDFDAAKARKVAVVATACDARALMTYIKENQFAREDVFVIGVTCPGPMLSRRKVLAEVGAYRLAGAEVDGDEVVVKTADGGEARLAVADYLDDACATCATPEPPLADVTFGDAGAFAAGDAYGRVREQEARASDERWAWLEAELGRCIRCYACRQACPACYCEECFAEQRNPPWLGPATAPEDLVAFHLVRVFHTAGRCAACGACERACPMDIPLRVLSDKLVKDVREKFGYDVGASLDEAPPLTTYSPDDANEGFM